MYVSHQFEEVLRLATHVVLIGDGRVAAQGDVASVSRDPALRAVLGPDAAGAVVEGEVERVDAAGIARVRIGAGRIAVPAQRAAAGLARARAGARERGGARHRGAARPRAGEPARGRDRRARARGPGSELVEVDVGGARLLARVSADRAAELDLAAGRRVWLVVSAATRAAAGFPGAAS